MKLRAPLNILLALLAPLASTFSLRAQTPHHHYLAIDVGTFGGPNSVACAPDCRLLNSSGAVVFGSDLPLPDPFASNPNDIFSDGNLEIGDLLVNGFSTPLNSIPSGYNAFPIWLSDTQLVAGVAENGLIDPATSYPEVIATTWRSNGTPVSLGTLGGNGSTAVSVNNAGQVVGAAANKIEDPFASGFFGYTDLWFPVTTGIHAFLWQSGFMRDLGTLGGADSSGSVINQAGQVAGFSFTNGKVNPTTGMPTIHPFLWEQGAMKDLGSLGGTIAVATFLNDNGQVIGYSNLAGDVTYHPFLWDANGMTDLHTLGGNNGSAIWINDAGQIVGGADLPGSQVHHAVLWQNGQTTDLGTVDGDPTSFAHAINSVGQVVGCSGNLGPGCTGRLHGFLWENGGPAVDISKLYPPFASGLKQFVTCCINDLGEMFGAGSLPNGDTHGILIIPCDQNHPNLRGCDYSTATVAAESEVPSANDSAQRVHAATPAATLANRPVAAVGHREDVTPR